MLNFTKGLLVVTTLIGMSCTNTDQEPTSRNGNTTEMTQRQEIDFNFGWKFSLAESLEKEALVYSEDFDDSQWRDIRLPHDWSIEAEYSQINTAGATGYLPDGKGWYRKRFNTPVSHTGDEVSVSQRKTQILFDGVYNHSKVWINGHLLGERPYGYSAFHYDLTPYLHTNGQENLIAVYVDHSRYVDSRWYTGSGIYRNVKLISTHKTHIPIWGSYVTTPKVDTSQATVLIATTVQNDSFGDKELVVLTELKDNTGKTIAKTEKTITVPTTTHTKVSQTLNINHPQLWSPDSPILYSVVTSLIENNKRIDSNTVTTGLRYFNNDPQKGFFINGKPTKIKGVNIHHDGGLVGSAVPKGVWKRRLQTLKDAGVNAIRTAHNPASTEFLDLCDEMGFLVQAEAFDEWDNPKDKRKNFNQSGEVDYITESYSQYFGQWAERDIKAMLLRDRNHPSIFQWSIGNEVEWTYPRYTQATGYWDKRNSGKHNYYWDVPPTLKKKSKNVLMTLP
ncbi:glycoside hydrolase family 2 TIM barrel-domain containing protein [Paraglaciecola aquimarina]|uniref:Glycoside hydrolase family 2 TIM barrel-domain containing protein n=1 Tax=Paraglaciecola aquimarina TaxID=1235557 RepID=A0ABU3SYM5_9ALTE|nr:sugar-binding domain-containing protein [Paraglaciecola aquimarina]MDU0355120.1 glycoside hydrolase family 2 TIM barrel-domain containing protein [Paraglaciecola aquimarina]